MNRYVIADADGEIIRTVVCAADQAATQAQAGETLTQHETATSSTHYVSAGELLAYDEVAQAAKASPPNSFVQWSNAEMAWVDHRSLVECKASKSAEINAARLAANRTSFTFSGKAIACDELSRGDIDGVNGIVSLTGALPPGFPNAWKAMDNTYVAIPDVATWVSFYGAMVAKGTENFAHSQELKAALAAATTPEEVEAIAW